MSVSARVLADSVSEDGLRITSIEATFHRFVLAEVNTHRQLSRNSASSRAIPVEKLLERFMHDPAYPLSWPVEQPGMSGGQELVGVDLIEAQELLREIHDATRDKVLAYLTRHPDKKHRLHKSVLNRTMEWAQWHTAIITATWEDSDWPNFFDLRISPQAQPEIRELAMAIARACDDSQPQLVTTGWHLPLIGFEGDEQLGVAEQVLCSSARCGRVSYLTHDGRRDVSADLGLAEQLRGNRHLSPFEHAAHPMLGRWGNLTGWRQARWYVERGLAIPELAPAA